MSARILDRPPPPRPPENAKCVVRLYRELGSVHAVARRLDRGQELIRRILADAGVALRNDGTRDPKIRGLYAGWRSMIRRCDDPTHRSFRSYGARSVGYVPAWAEFPAFRDWSLAHGWRRGMNLLLRDPLRDHGPANCYWGTHTEMLRLRSRVATLTRSPVTAFGEVKSAFTWAHEARCRVTYVGLLRRLRCGWPPELAISLPPGAPAPTRRVARRPIKKLGDRIDWDRAVAMRRAGKSVAEIAAVCRCALSTLYVGLEERGVAANPYPTRRRIDDGPLYSTWNRMCQLCRGKDRGRRDARTPAMDPSWLDYEVFRRWARAVRYRSGQCLVRVDPELPYAPRNCRFVERKAIRSRPEAHSTPLGRPRFLIRALGTAKGITDWARDRRCSVTAITIGRRLRAGWAPDDAVTAPATRVGSRGHAWSPVTAFGVTKGVVEWARDRRCKVGAGGLATRLAKGMDPEVAITTPPYGTAVGRGRAAG